MRVNIVSLSSDKKSSQELNDSIYGLDPRSDILHRVVTWQLSKRRSGTHKVKERGEIKGSTKKIMAQKGSGGARHSTRKVNLFRGGGVAFGPKPRDYSTKLPKKIRTLGLKHALSAKVKNDELIILDEAKLSSPKTKDLVSKIKKLTHYDCSKTLMCIKNILLVICPFKREIVLDFSFFSYQKYTKMSKGTGRGKGYTSKIILDLYKVFDVSL
mgnify:CR=1 FL=1